MVAGVIELTNKVKNYKVISDTHGEFKFFHISAGTYFVKANYTGFRQLNKDTIHLGTGDITEMKIGMGCLGQGDINKR